MTHHARIGILCLVVAALVTRSAAADDLRAPPSTERDALLSADVPVDRSPWIAAGLSSGATLLGATGLAVVGAF